MLQHAGRDESVSEWEYQPYMLNGEPVDVITEITVNFVLN